MHLRHRAAAFGLKPAILLPYAVLGRRSAPEGRAARAGQRAGAAMRLVVLPAGRPRDLAVTGALQRRIGRSLGRKEMHVRVQLVGAVDAAGTRHGDGVLIGGAALGHGQVVPTIALIKMRPLDKAQRASGEDVLRLADKPSRLWVVFLQEDARESGALGIAADGFAAVVPEHVEEPLSPVVIVEEGWVEA